MYCKCITIPNVMKNMLFGMLYTVLCLLYALFVVIVVVVAILCFARCWIENAAYLFSRSDHNRSYFLVCNVNQFNINSSLCLGCCFSVFLLLLLLLRFGSSNIVFSKLRISEHDGVLIFCISGALVLAKTEKTIFLNIKLIQDWLLFAFGKLQ